MLGSHLKKVRENIGKGVAFHRIWRAICIGTTYCRPTPLYSVDSHRFSPVESAVRLGNNIRYKYVKLEHFVHICIRIITYQQVTLIYLIYKF